MHLHLLLVTFLLSGPIISQADEIALTYRSLYATPIGGGNTHGWAFLPVLAPGEQMIITSIGVFDEDGNGLFNTHQVGLWTTPGGDGALLASATVPAGSGAPLVEGFRFTSLSPAVPLPLGRGFIIGAYYSAADGDDLVRPNAVTFSPRVFEPSPIGGLAGTIQLKSKLIQDHKSSGLEGFN